MARATPWVNESLKASPGYFSLQLKSGIRGGVKGEATAAFHTALYKFTFSGGAGDKPSPLILLDLSDLSDSRQDNASLSIEENGRITGESVFNPSFGTGMYTAYFCADFKGSIRDTGIFVNSRASSEVQKLTISRGINGYPLPGGAWIRFTDSEPVTIRQGFSFISRQQACELAEAEIPDFDFKGTRDAAVEAWTDKLKRISVDSKGVEDSVVKNFYSGIYRTFMNPQNYTGVQPVVDENTIYFDSFYWYVCCTQRTLYGHMLI